MPRYPTLSSAAHGLSSSVYTSLLSLAQTHAKEVFTLNVGDTYRLPPAPARLETLASFGSRADPRASFGSRADPRASTAPPPGLYNYAPVQGDPELLDAIGHDLTARGRGVPRALIQVTSGATSGLDIACRTLLAPGDEVIVLAPFWPLIRGIVSATGAVPVELPFFTELRKPGFDLRAALSGALTARTVALYVNHPHNPSGVVLRADEMEVLSDFVASQGLWLLSDEAYERLHYTPEAPAALWTHPKLRECAVVAHTFSKTFGLAGARVGFVHGPERVMEAVSGLQTFATYCAPSLSQKLIAQALSSDEATAWLDGSRALYAEAAALTAATLSIATPESGTFVIFDTRPFLRAGESAADLLSRCAKRGVVLTPGAATGAAYADYARLCFTAIDGERLARALTILKEELAP